MKQTCVQRTIGLFNISYNSGGIMPIRTLFMQIFRHHDLDPILDQLLLKWRNSLDDTLNQLAPNSIQDCIDNLTELENVLSEYSTLKKQGSYLRAKNYLQSVTNDFTKPFLHYHVPVFISHRIPGLIQIPCNGGVDFVLNAGSEIPSLICILYSYFALPHEIGHLLIQIQLKTSWMNLIAKRLGIWLKERTEELGITNYITDAWMDVWNRWLLELVADQFALDTLGPSYAYFFTEANWMRTMGMDKTHGDEKYPPEDLRTHWMVRKLSPRKLCKKCNIAGRQYKSDLVPWIRGFKRNNNYDMKPDFWIKYDVPEGEKGNWRNLLFDDDIYSVVMEMYEAMPKVSRVEFAPEKVGEAIRSLKAGLRPTTDMVSSFAALIETYATSMMKGIALNIDNLVLQ